MINTRQAFSIMGWGCKNRPNLLRVYQMLSALLALLLICAVWIEFLMFKGTALELHGERNQLQPLTQHPGHILDGIKTDRT